MPSNVVPQTIPLYGRLAYNAGNAARWLSLAKPSSRVYHFIHYTDAFCSPLATQDQEIAQLNGFADYHIQKDWSSDQSGVYGWTIMYHWAIAPSGRIYSLNPPEHILWNTTGGNGVGVATVLMLGQGQDPTPAMLQTLDGHSGLVEADQNMHIVRARTFGHGECDLIYGGGPAFGNNTNCPGNALSWVRNHRVIPPTPPPAPGYRFFSLTGHTIGHGFKDLWEEYEKLGVALTAIGYPISEEQHETVGSWSGTVQYFERARMEYHSELTPPQVLFGRLGVEVLDYHNQTPPIVIAH